MHGALNSSVIIYHSWGVLRLYFCYSSYLVSRSHLVFDGLQKRTWLSAIISALKPKLIHANAPPSTSTATMTKGKKPKPTKAHLAREIKFDLFLTRCSFMIDLLSNAFVMLSPMPSYKIHGFDAASSHSKESSQALFVLATSLSSLGSGALPAIQSLALCILQVRALDAGEANGGRDEGVGSLFGALAVLQAAGQMILGVSVNSFDDKVT